LTNTQQARQDFIQVRLDGQDTTNDSHYTLLPPSQMQHSPVSEAEKKRAYQEYILSRWPYIFAGCLVLILLLIGFCIRRCCCKRGKDGRRRCICCSRRDKKGGFSQVEKGRSGNHGVLPRSMQGSTGGRTKAEGVPSVYIPLEDQQSYGHPDAKSPVPPVYDDYGRASSVDNMPSPPPTAYGLDSYQSAHQTPTRSYGSNQSTRASPVHGGFYPPGLGGSGPFADPAYGHRPNNGS